MKRETFGSRLGFILVSAGCAIGIGNVWKFPYLCGEMGGAAFILIYLVFLFVMGIPVLVTEFAVGYYRKLSSDDVLYDRWRLDALLLLSLCDRRVRGCVF